MTPDMDEKSAIFRLGAAEGVHFKRRGILCWWGAIFRGWDYTVTQFSKKQLFGVQSSGTQFSKGGILRGRTNDF